MANVGTAAAGKTLIGAGNGVSPTFASIGTNSGLTNHGVVIGQGNNPFITTTAGNNSQVLVGGLGGTDPAFGSTVQGNFTFNGSAAAQTRVVTIANLDNSSTTSNSLLQLTTGGSSSGDPFATFSVTGVTNWSMGIDNSASDAFVISASTALGTTNVMSMATNGLVDCVLNDFRSIRSNSGGIVNLEANNTSNTANSDALLLATVAGTSGGDAYSRYSVEGAGVWSLGIDNSDSDAFVVSANAALGTNNLIRGISTGGQYRGNSANTTPPTGFIGEEIRSFIPAASAITLSTGTGDNITTISLEAGIYDVSCVVQFSGAGGSVTGVQFVGGISLVSDTVDIGLAGGDAIASIPTAPTASSDVTVSIPSHRMLISGTTTVYLVARAIFSVGTVASFGRISATRVG